MLFYGKKIASIILIIIGITFVSLLCFEDVRAACKNVIITFYEKYIQFDYTNDNDTRLENLSPKYIPEGFELIQSYSDEWELYIHGGDICKKLKKYDEAFKYWGKAEELGTNFMDGKYAKASCYEDLGEYENAYKAWSELAEELLSKGYDVEAEMPKKQAKLYLEKLNKS